jgi:hypothetical protein
LGASSFHNINWQQTGDALHRSLLVDATVTVTVSLCYYYYYYYYHYHRHEAKIRTCLLFFSTSPHRFRSAAKGEERPKWRKEKKKDKLMTAVKRNTGAQSHINVSDDSALLLFASAGDPRPQAKKSSSYTGDDFLGNRLIAV